MIYFIIGFVFTAAVLLDQERRRKRSLFEYNLRTYKQLKTSVHISDVR